MAIDIGQKLLILFYSERIWGMLSQKPSLKGRGTESCTLEI